MSIKKGNETRILLNQQITGQQDSLVAQKNSFSNEAILKIIAVVGAVISGVLALIGGFLGAYFNRKTQHQTWLLQKRAEVFAEFLRILEKCNDETSQIFRDPPKTRMEREQKVLDIYVQAFSQAKIVRLFIKNNARDDFEKLVRQVYALHTNKELEGVGVDRIQLMLDKRGEIQKILEDNLRDPKW